MSELKSTSFSEIAYRTASTTASTTTFNVLAAQLKANSTIQKEKDEELKNNFKCS